VKRVLLAVFLFAGLSYSDSAVLLQTDFNQLPQGWVSDEDWAFGSFGAALCVSLQETTWSGEFSTEGDPLVRFPVPHGTDSVIVAVDHWVLLSASPVKSGASSSAAIQLWTTQSGWGDYIFSHSVSDSLYAEEMISTYVLTGIPQDTFLGFRFRGDLTSDSQSNYAEIIWQVNGMTVTAYGDVLPLSRSTWASIKASF